MPLGKQNVIFAPPQAERVSVTERSRSVWEQPTGPDRRQMRTRGKATIRRI